MSVMASAAANYNEVYNAITLPDGRLGGDPSQRDPMFCWDTHFPDRLARLTLAADFTAPCSSPSAVSGCGAGTGGSGGGRPRNPRSRRNNRNAARFKTQPITFDEIKEVDEEAVGVAGSSGGGAAAGGAVDAAKSPTSEEAKESLKNQFANFSRSMDGLVVAPFVRRGESGADGGTGGAAPSTGSSGAGGASSEEDPGESHLHRGGSATSATIQRQQFRQRRKKRHTKSIEEAPELDKAAELLDSATTG